jgi:hypothetical protein
LHSTAACVFCPCWRLAAATQPHVIVTACRMLYVVSLDCPRVKDACLSCLACAWQAHLRACVTRQHAAEVRAYALLWRAVLILLRVLVFSHRSRCVRAQHLLHYCTVQLFLTASEISGYAASVKLLAPAMLLVRMLVYVIAAQHLQHR